ncbi:hypothetical protein BMETH_1934_0 [methanotrophic bacterial endosymbiont of Bathymodiolus sp.]|nr:hypothetical protein BMETH_1934_0 [methanotrophic bacterial endosymbiont of Bathymodiolus sp.]
MIITRRQACLRTDKTLMRTFAGASSYKLCNYFNALKLSALLITIRPTFINPPESLLLLIMIF